MTTDDALQFLRSYQPLPPTRDIREEVLAHFEEVREHFFRHPDNRCIPLFLNSFGEGDGHGVYQLVEAVILAHPEEIVIPALLSGLQSPHRSVREWNAEIAANYSRPELISPLADILRNGGLDERLAAVIALEAVGTPEAQQQLKVALNLDIENEVKGMIRKSLSM